MTVMIPQRSNVTASYSRLLTTLRAKLPGASVEQLQVEMGNCFQAFLRETHVWRELVKRNLIAGASRYELSPSNACAQVTFILAVRVSRRMYRPMGDVGFTGNGTSGAYQVDSDYTSIELFPTPNVNEPKGLEAWVALSLEPTSLDLPCELIDHYFDMLMSGVLERMYAHVARPYTNQDLAEKHARKFHAAVTRTRREVRGGNAYASPPWVYPQMAAGRKFRGGRSNGW
jgi:hypothetical protein